MFQEDVRTQFHKHKEVIESQDRLHSRAAEIFKRRLDAKTLDVEGRFKDEDWKDLAAEWVYHLLHFDPVTGLKTIRLICAEALAVWTYGGRPEVVFCSEFLESLGRPAAPERVDQEISSLRASINALQTENDVKALKMLHELVKVQGLTPEQEAALRDWIGQIHMWDEERLAPALDQFKMAWRLTPKDAVVHAHIAEVYYSPGATWGRFDLAQQHALEAMELSPTKATGYIALGKIAEKQENYEEAITWYQKAIEAEPQTFSGYLSQSEVYSACGDWRRALAKIDEAVKASPDIKYHALVRRGNVYKNARLYKEARDEYEQAIAEAPDRIDAYRELGRVYAIVWHVAEAENEYRKLIELEPEAADGYVNLGRLYEQQGKPDRAIAIGLEARDKKIEAKGLYILLSDLYGQQNRLEDIQREQEQLVRFDPTEEYVSNCVIGDAWLDKAQRHRGAQHCGRWLDKARSEYEKALTIDANRAWAYLSLARLAVIQDATDTVQQLQQSIVERAPWAKYEMLVSLGRAHLENSQYTESETTLLAATEMGPRRTEGWRALSDLYHRQGKPEGVMRTCSELVNINPTLAYDMRMSAGDAYRQIADYARAREEYNHAKEIEPDTCDAYLALAGVDEDEDQWEDAIENYYIVENKAPGLAAIAYKHIAAVYRDQKRYDDAERAARRAIFLDSEDAELYIELARLGAARGEEGLVEEGRRRLSSLSADKLYDFDKAIGDVYRLAEKYKESEQAYRECLTRDPGRAEAYIGLGLLQLSQGFYPETKEWLNRALEIDSANVEAYSALSQMYEDQQNLQDVIL
jgi:tetratricopeptide (TPR) repeat protein